MKVVFCVPTITRPYDQCLNSLAMSIPDLDSAGIEHSMVVETGCPYISSARATMLRKALDAKADAAVFIDHDLSWEPSALAKLCCTEGDVVAGTYRFKYHDKEEYMAVINDGRDFRPIVRPDGCISASRVPAGFLKVTKEAVDKFMKAYPNLVYGPAYNPSVDLFNHGAHQGAWWGEDYAFSRNWTDCGGEIWLVPDLDITHHDGEKGYPGNFHKFLLRQPGGSEAKE